MSPRYEGKPTACTQADLDQWLAGASGHLVRSAEEGGYSEALVSEEQFCVAADGNCPYPAVAEPLSCVVNAVGLAAPRLADDAVIISAGFMGNLLQLAVQLRDSRTVTVADVRRNALERAASLGATYTVDTSSEDLAGRVAEITDGRGRRYTPGVYRYRLVSVPGGPLCALEPWLWLNLEISVVGIDCHEEVVQEAF